MFRFKRRSKGKFTAANLLHVTGGQEAACSRILAAGWRFEVWPHGHYDTDRVTDVREKPATLRLRYNLLSTNAAISSV